jgi:hypothetical protein
MSAVDLDRLADFLGGALDGTPDQEEVRSLLACDPEWALAYEQLSLALVATDQDLRHFGEQDPQLPDDLLARLDSALDEVLNQTLDRAPNNAAQARSGRPAAQPTAGWIRRWFGWLGRPQFAVAAVVATALVLGVAFSLPQLVSGSRNAGKASAVGDSPLKGMAGNGPTTGSSAGAIVLNSGTDYSRGNVVSVISAAQNPAADSAVAPSLRGERSSNAPKNASGEGAGSAASGPQPGSPDFGQSGNALRASELARLGPGAGLDSCITAVASRHGGQVTVVDYARFEGQAALVLVLVGAAETPGRRLVIVVGPNCGVSGQSDERYSVAG